MLPAHKAAAVAAIILLSLFLPGTIPVVGQEGGPQTITLYGGQGGGWGLTSGSLSNPGPNLTAFAGYPLTLILNSVEADTIVHDWFVDYDNDGNREPGEPGSQEFRGANPLSFTFTPDLIGNWTYRCSIHPTQMTGKILVVAQTNVTLHGHAGLGWGLSNTSIRSPGPGLVLFPRTNVTFRLIANDSAAHNFFIDYNGDGSPSAGEPKTIDFSPATPLTVTLPIDRAGNFTYYCQYHGLMRGTVLVLGPPPPGGGFNVALIPGILIAALGGVLVFAAVYQVRAVRAARRR